MLIAKGWQISCLNLNTLQFYRMFQQLLTLYLQHHAFDCKITYDLYDHLMDVIVHIIEKR